MFTELLFGSSTAHIIFILAATIALGTLLGKVKLGGVTLGVTWILFVGIAFGHFKMGIVETNHSSFGGYELVEELDAFRHFQSKRSSQFLLKNVAGGL